MNGWNSGRLDNLIHGLIFRLLPPTLVGILAMNLLLDDDSRWLRLGVFGLFLFIGLINQSYVYGAVILSCLWFEGPTLIYRFPNQFIIEVAALAAVFSTWLVVSFKKNDDVKFDLHKLFEHPFVNLLAFAIPAAFIANLISLGFLKYLNHDLSLARYFLLFTRNAFDWNAKFNPVHGLSIMTGYLISFVFISYLLKYRSRLFSKAETIVTLLIVGFVPVLLFGLGQLFWRATVPRFFTVDIGGTLQNGNHLSFVGGLVFLLTLYQVVALRKISLGHIAILLAASTAVLIGKGRATWVGLALSLCLIYGQIWYLFLRSKNNNQHKIHLILFSCFLFSLPLILFLAFDHIPKDIQLQYQALLREFKDPSVQSIQYAGGRKHHIDVAINMFFESPFSGHGLGNFMAKSRQVVDIHNIYLTWLWEFGILSIPALIAAIFPFFYMLYRRYFDHKHPLLVGVIFATTAFIGLTALIDNYLSYRSIGLFVGIAFVYCVDRYELNDRNKSWTPLFFLVCIFLGIGSGILSLLNPHFRYPVINHQYAKELDLNEKILFHWAGLAQTFPLSEKQCLRVELKSPAELGENQIKVFLVDERKVLGVQYPRELGSYLKSIDTAETFEISAGSWIPYCFCAEQINRCADKSCSLGIVAKRGAILSTLANHQDDRFISLGIREIRYFDFNQKNEFSFCDYLSIFSSKAVPQASIPPESN